MRLFLIVAVVCACFTQAYSGDTITKKFRPSSSWTGLSDSQLERIETNFGLIKGISSDAVTDINNTLEKFRQNYAVYKLFNELDELFRKDLGAYDNVLNATYVIQYFSELKEQKDIYKTNEIVDLIEEYEDIFAEKLTPNQVARIMTLFRVIEGTPRMIENCLSYLYGMPSFTLSTPAVQESSAKACVKKCIDRCF